MKFGIDMVAAIYIGLLSYAEILKTNGETDAAKQVESVANPYQEHIDKYWWDEEAGHYNTFYTNSGTLEKMGEKLFYFGLMH